MGLQIKIVKYFSAPEQLSCRAANFPAVFSRADAKRRSAASRNQNSVTTGFTSELRIGN
jgi:hypothetical protein